ncbi:MAG: glycosyltransferase family 4 protein [Prochlorotrichaceae cyanobacterium]|jgi:glycosyltransferase involved in cell wall biosynthesis
MKIVVDATSIRSRPSGIGIYSQNLLEGMIQVLGEGNYTCFEIKVLYKSNRGLSNLRKHLSVTPVNHFNFTYYPFPSETSLQVFRRSRLATDLLELFLGKPDIFHGLDYLNYPLRTSRNILTIHDLSFIRYPQYAPERVLKTYQKRLSICSQWTDLIITMSENSKKDIIEFLNIDSQKIRVIPLASRYGHSTSQYQLSSHHQDLSQTAAPFPFPYLLFISTLEPRKNIQSLIQAFEILKQQHHIPHHLILIGKKGWKYEAIFAAIESSPVKHHIHHLDYLDDRQLPQFYQWATAFLYPSHYEGFGLPVLEAMAFGVPVITSNQAALPEVTGDAALLVHPEDIEGLVTATRSLLENPELRTTLSQAGKARSLLFSWKTTALKTLEAYQSL